MTPSRRQSICACLVGTWVASCLVGQTPGVSAIAAPATFRDRTAALGLKLQPDSACWVDIDHDGWVDLCASGAVWKNNGGKRFTKIAEIGPCVATDIDNDGHFDLFAGNFAHVDHRGDQPKSRFLKNLGPSQSYHFRDRGPCGIYYQESYATPAAGDYDNDGRLDLFFTTVYGTASFRRKNDPVLFRQESPFVFADATASVGLAKLPPTSQAAWADFNNDGHLDLVAAGKLFVHQGTANHWLKARLEGDGRIVNRSAIGTQVRVRLGDQILTRQVEAGTGEGNQNELTLHFGLGSHAAPVPLEILWPNASRQVVGSVLPDRTISIRFGKKLDSDECTGCGVDCPESGTLLCRPDRPSMENALP